MVQAFDDGRSKNIFTYQCSTGKFSFWVLAMDHPSYFHSHPSFNFTSKIFISIEDKICYISSGTRIAAILPWWRLEHVVQDIKPDLRKGNIGAALGVAIDELTDLLQVGPPSFLDRVDDFVERFGVVIAFTIFTFVFATWGECRDRRKRLFNAERMSRMTAAEKKRARMLQREFRSKAVSVPVLLICIAQYFVSELSSIFC